MAKYIVKFACGHEKEIQLFGKHEDREKKIAWLETQECEDCIREKRKEETEMSKAKRGLSNLNGSERQVSWGEIIRERVYKALDSIKEFAQTKEAMDMVSLWESKMKSKSEARWWIENRYNLPNINDGKPAIVRSFMEIL